MWTEGINKGKVLKDLVQRDAHASPATFAAALVRLPYLVREPVIT